MAGKSEIPDKNSFCLEISSDVPALFIGKSEALQLLWLVITISG
jgi:hypothetical protein